MGKVFDKNRLLRLFTLDKLLSGNKNGYTMNELIVNIEKQTGEKVDRYAIGRDFKFLKDKLGVNILKKDDIIYNKESDKYERRVEYSYEDVNHSIFKGKEEKMTNDEKDYLAFALSLIGLKGMSHTAMFRKLDLKVQHNNIISFTKNPLEKKIGNIFETLLHNIKNKDVISFKLRNRKPPHVLERQHVHPWFLREYNRRWYLFGYDIKKNTIERYALDRIIRPINVLTKYVYKEPTLSIDEILEDIIGVSTSNQPPIEIRFWVSDKSSDYVCKKPLHRSQNEIERKNILGIDVDKYKGGKFFEIFCKINYELKRELLSFNEALIVLSPDSLRVELKETLSKMLKMYEV